MRKSGLCIFFTILCLSLAIFGCTNRSGNVKIDTGTTTVADILNDYPTDGEEIPVIGTFGTYMEDGELYCTLKESDFWKE